MMLDDEISTGGEEERARGSLIVEVLRTHMVAEAVEPARRVRQLGNGILVADLALEGRADEGARGLGGIQGGTAAPAASFY